MRSLDYIIKTFNLPPLQPRQKNYELTGGRDETLTKIFRELGYRVGAEIGIERGVYSKTLCETIPGLTLYGIDPWMAYHGYREHVSQDKLDGFYEETLERMKPYNFRPFRAYSTEAHKYFRDESLDFVYVDGNHGFLNATQDIILWEPKVRKGGIIAGHDYRRNSGKYINDVKDVVPALTYALKIRPWFIVREEHGAASWFWVKGEEYEQV